MSEECLNAAEAFAHTTLLQRRSRMQRLILKHLHSMGVAKIGWSVFSFYHGWAVRTDAETAYGLITQEYRDFLKQESLEVVTTSFGREWDYPGLIILRRS